MITDDPKIYHFPDPEWTPGKPGVDWQLVAAPKDVKTGAEANVNLLIADLFRAIETDTQSVASFYEARGVLEMLLAVYASQLRGGRVSFPLKEREHPLGAHSHDDVEGRYDNTTTRREFLIATAGVGVCSVTGLGQARSPNEKLNIGFIGVTGRGGQNMAEMAGENVAALCDVDERHLGKGRRKIPQGTTVPRLPQDDRRGEGPGCGGHLDPPPYPRARHGEGAAGGETRLLRKAAHPYGLGGARGGGAGREAQGGDPAWHQRPYLQRLPARRRARSGRRDRSGAGSPCLVRRELWRGQSSHGSASRPGASGLGPLAGAVSREALPQGLPPLRLALLFGLRRGDRRQHGPPLARPALLGAETPLPAERGGRRSSRGPRVAAEVADRPVRVSARAKISRRSS